MRIAFSEPIGGSDRDVARGYEVTGGVIAEARRVRGRSDLWRLTVEPEGDDDVTLALAAGRACTIVGVPCTRDGRMLSEDFSLTVPRRAPASLAALTAQIDPVPDGHDGVEPFEVRIVLSEAIRNSYKHMDDVASVEGGTATAARRENGRSDIWLVTVEPGGEGPVTVTLDTGGTCGRSRPAVLCMGDGRSLAESDEITVVYTGDGPREPALAALTARIEDAPAEHDGSGGFEVRVAFSEAIVNSYKHVHRAATVEGGTTTSAKRVNRRSDLWLIRVLPSGNGPVTFTLAGGGTCGSERPSVLCTRDGRALSNTVSVEVLGPAALSVADARAEETDDAIEFTVSLDREATKLVSVDYATRDGSAKAGEDNRSTSGTLFFAVGDREKTVSVDLGYDQSIPRCCQHPHNVWPRQGLVECVAQGGDANEHRLLRQRLAFAKARADVPIESACYCRTVAKLPVEQDAPSA